MKPTPPDPRSPKDIWDEQYQLLKGNPWLWLHKAESLMTAFEALIVEDDRIAQADEPRRLESVAYMLAGFAMENLLKGRLIALQGAAAQKGSFKFKGHDLRQLAADAGYLLSDDDNNLLERLEQFAVWTGRYPIPMNPEDMRPRARPGGGFAPRTHHFQGEDWPAIRGLVERFTADLRAMC